jgi:hypothetical protein
VPFAPVLYFGLGREHLRHRRIFAAVWLTSCTYPLVALVIPEIFDPTLDRALYLLLAESIAVICECLLFWAAFRPLKQPIRDLVCVFLANLTSFGLAELYYCVAL